MLLQLLAAILHDERCMWACTRWMPAGYAALEFAEPCCETPTTSTLQYYRKLMGVELSTNMMIDILDKVDGNLDGGGRLFAAEA